MPQILVVEDEQPIRDMIAFALRRAGHEVREAQDCRSARVQIADQRPDLVLVDWMLPDQSGLELTRLIKREPDTRDLPVIMLTARASERDKIAGLDGGADDYVTKPFSPRELVARVNAVLRRVRPALAGEQLSYGDLTMDIVSHKVKRNGEPISLGPTEFRLLRHFMEHPTRVFSRERLLDSVWGHDSYIEPRTVDVHIRRLRKAINAGGRKDIIRTVRSAGYALDVEDKG